MIDRSLGILYIRATLMGPLTLFMLLFSWIVSIIYFDMFKGKLPKLLFFVIGFPFYFTDFIYNVIVGSFIFWEFPKELIYTQRVARHRNGTGAKATYAKFACAVLGSFDPNHCDKA